jgi:hypothetical protein
MSGSTMLAGTLTQPKAARASVTLCAAVKAVATFNMFFTPLVPSTTARTKQDMVDAAQDVLEPKDDEMPGAREQACPTGYQASQGP